MPEFRANTLGEAVRMAVGGELNLRDQTKARGYEQKRIPEVFAPPLIWGQWVEVFAQAGVAGPEPDKNVTKLRISFRSVNRTKATFGIEISGGDRELESFGPGAEVVTITGNVATGIKIRAKSFALFGQSIDVDVRQIR